MVAWRLTSVPALPNARLRVIFVDGTANAVDRRGSLSTQEVADTLFEPLRDPADPAQARDRRRSVSVTEGKAMGARLVTGGTADLKSGPRSAAGCATFKRVIAAAYIMLPMRGHPQDLPDFRRPPVAETVLSLQFEPISGLTTAHVGLLWQRFRDQLPLVEEQPPLPPAFERFDAPKPPEVEVTVEEKLPAPRVWFLNRAKTELIQVQPDRLVHNWRKVEGIEPYPRYERIRDDFRREAETFERFLNDEGLGALNVNQCEVTYVNHIEGSGIWGRHGQLDTVLRNWSRLPTGAFLGEPEDAVVRMRFVIPGEGKPAGRLHVAFQPARKKTDNSPLFLMTLTARGAPLGDGMEGAFAFFDLGRPWIVKAFADLTTPGMHLVWERIHA
jgi:uncharacterized protein (TIGR04255 family)